CARDLGPYDDPRGDYAMDYW
nr:immunoglobulin heavy chain junction region [Mus musculus]MBK4186706.1 immunoglobulin heavy chain junction region [Mus musculus]